MAVTWTKEQQQVIDLRGCNMLVSAAAGSGKTAVLVERILSKLMDLRYPVDIDRLLIVTFTNAAAGEMKDRIRSAIEKKIEELENVTETEALAEHLQRQISLLSNAQITTIHSFCQYVIRNHFHTIELDPGLRIADEGEQKLLQNDVMEKLLEECYGEESPEFLHMAEYFAPGRDDKALADTALSLYHFSTGFPWPEKWLQECKQAYAVETLEQLDSAPWVGRMMELTDHILEEAREQIKEALCIAALEDGPYPYEEALGQDLKLLEDLLAAKTYSERSRVFEGAGAWARLSSKRDKQISEEKREQVKAIRDRCKKMVGELREEFFCAPPQTEIEQMRACAPAAASMIDFTCRFIRRFSEEKQRKGMMDFDDLEHFALQILVREEEGNITPTPVALEFAEHYEEIMIDEYQDSNLVQEMILGSISKMSLGSYNMFMVGDVKQSIYRFRLARPELFMEKYRAYSEDQGSCRRIDLHRNFRSRAQVLECVNFLFEQAMEESLGNIQYDEAAALYPGALFAPGDEEAFRKTELLLIDTEIQEEEEQPEETVRELEARAAAARIKEIVGRELVWDKEQETYRTARYSDIVILLRTVQGWAEVFARILTDMDIPAHTGSRTGYFSTTEVQTVLSLLQVIDNPRQDIPLAAVLHSPIGGLSGEEMAGIKSRHPEKSFFEACREEEALQGFFGMLEEFRDMAVYMPIHELLWHILDRTGYGAYAAAMPGGSQRKANLDMLIQKAIAYETGSYRGLYNFVRYIENLHKYDVDFGEAGTDSETEDTVRILSIHKSKGLEFPVVFVCGMGKQINQMDARSAVITHGDFGIGCDYVDVGRRVRRASLLKRFIRRQTVQESLGEELRVLYVALTRAKEKLILMGTMAKMTEKLKNWSDILRRQEAVLPFSRRARASTYWDWVVPALMRNQCFAPLLRRCEIEQNRDHPLYSREIFCEVKTLCAAGLARSEAEQRVEYMMTQEELLALPEDAVFDAETAARLEEHMTFRYAYEKEADIPSKVSVSELKRLAQFDASEDGELLYQEPEPVPLIPRFLKDESEVSGAARGTIYHKLMECLDFTLPWGGPQTADAPGEKKTQTADAPGERKTQKADALQKRRELLENEISRMTEQGHLSGEEAELIDRVKILKFLESPLAERMRKAAEKGRLYREQPFVLEVPASRIQKEWSSHEQVLIQGIIDAYFVEKGAVILVDYKTDFVKSQEAYSLYAKYEVQLTYYQEALERLTHLPVKEKLIYSFCLNRALTGGTQAIEEH